MSEEQGGPFKIFDSIAVPLSRLGDFLRETGRPESDSSTTSWGSEGKSIFGQKTKDIDWNP